jgi:uncharacterized OsmC-like protein
VADISVLIQSQSESPTKTVVKAREFDLVVDEPADLGGENEGPTPVEYLLAGFTGCLNVVGHLVANDLGFELRSIRFKATGPIDPAKLFGQETEQRPGFKNIDIQLSVDADADEATLQEWLTRVEARCPISDNISNFTPVSLNLHTSEQSVAA